MIDAAASQGLTPHGAKLTGQLRAPGQKWLVPNNLPVISSGIFGAAGSEGGTKAIDEAKAKIGK